MSDEQRPSGDAARFDLPRPLLDRPGADLSFSGLKTALRRAASAGSRALGVATTSTRRCHRISATLGTLAAAGTAAPAADAVAPAAAPAADRAVTIPAVPRPTYLDAPEMARPLPAPLETPAPTGADTRPQDAARTADDQISAAAEQDIAALDLDNVLARRRAC